VAPTVRGEKRKLLAKEVILNHNGSAKAYFESEFGKDENYQPPSECVVRRAFTGYRNKDNLPHNPQGINMISNQVILII